jgi:ubiquinone/menaquinone biosynthesis C-methylase UbiE
MTDPGAFPDHFSDRATEYARYRPSWPREVVDHLAALAPGRDLAWDAGCGSGQLSLLLAERFRRVRATDASEHQLARAAPHPRVEYVEALAQESGLPAGSVDLATAAQAAHWFDLDPYFAEVQRVVRPGGIVALLSYGLAETASDADRVMEQFHREVLAPRWPPQCRHVEEGYRHLPFPFHELTTPSFAMEARWTGEDFLGYLETWSTMRNLEQEEGRERIDAFREELLRVWRPDEIRLVRWPLALRVGRI